ncbi:lichenysin biosynthesis thioesterase LicTE [Bacillus haynesii]|uniref:lichenysin biosynthesis thioesterase LicTE n=1 Tax=Bacillus haynesii TaxID=1925021 RepID=UPI00228047E6|nr:lichenysin biosynthesis thioesterase LicTE [Bacillus haynesii]MCY8670771.1 lichenysin biosynthesis thioesterase LicTE [Bacillus haynesii]
MDEIIKQFGAPASGMQLICFPFAGGYSASFRPLYEHLKADFDMLAIEPPGHGTNRMALIDNLEELVDLYIVALKPRLSSQFVLFGHSMGGMVVYRLAQKLEQEGIFPAAVVISAIQPPHIQRQMVSHKNDDAFLDHLIQLGGIPQELAEHGEIMRFFLPSFRADYRALETFCHTDHTPLMSPVHILNGDRDEKCMKDALGWKKWARTIDFHYFKGGHMYLLSETEQVAAKIKTIAAARRREAGPAI